MTFDPNAPFEIVAPPPQAAPPPAFDPNAPFEVAAQPAAPPPQRGVFDGLGARIGINVGEGFRGGTVGESLERIRSGQTDARGAQLLDDAIRAAEAAGSDVGVVMPNPDRAFGGVNPYTPFVDVPLEELRRRREASQAASAAALEQHRTVTIPERQAAEQAIGPWNESGASLRSAVQGLGALAGQFFGAMMAPESMIGPAGSTGRRLITTEGTERLIPYLGRQALESGAPNAIANLVPEPLIQGGQIERGERQDYSAGDAALSAAMGGLIGTVLPVSGEMARSLWARLSSRRAASGTAPDAPPSPAELESVMLPEDVRAIAEANGLTDPNDPRIAPLAQRLEARRQAEASRILPATSAPAEGPAPSAMTSAGRMRQEITTDAERARATDEAVAARIEAQVAAEERAAAASGRPFDAERTRAQLLAAEQPPRQQIGTIEVTPSGQAIPLAPDGTMTPEARSANAGLRARSRPEGMGALVPVEPQPTRLTERQINVMREENARTGDGVPGGQPRMVAPEGRLPQTREQATSQAQAGEAFSLAATRAGRRDAALAGGEPPPADVRAGGRPEGRGEPERFTYLDATMDQRRGEMVGGRRVEVVMENGREAAVRDVDTGMVEIVQTDRLTTVGRPSDPRMSQEFMGASREPPRGTGTTGPAPRRATDRIASRAVTDAPPAEYVGRVDPGPSGRTTDVPGDPRLPPGPPPRAPETPRALPAPTRALPAPEAPRATAPDAPPSPSPRVPDARTEQFRAQAERSERAAARLDEEAANLQRALDRHFDKQSGANLLAQRGAKMPRDLEGRTIANIARQYANAKAIGRAILAKQREAETARGRAEIQRRGAERAGTPDAVPYRPSYGDPKLDATASASPPKAPQSLTDAVRRLGGIKGHAGELEGQAPGVSNARGLTPDLMVARLQENGWLPGKDGLDAERALFEGLAEERRGRRQYRDGDRADYEAARQQWDVEQQTIADIGREMGLSPDQMRALTRGQFEDLIRERMSQEEISARIRDDVAAIEDEIAAIRREAQDEMAARGDAWEPDINRTLDEYLDSYGTRSLDDAEAEWRRAYGEGAGKPAAASEASGGSGPVGRSPPSDRTGAGPVSEGGPPPGRTEGPDGGTGAARDGGTGQQSGEGLGRDPLRRTTEGDGQAVMPGMEASTKQAIAAREAQPMRGQVPQRNLGDETSPLFDVSARDQTDMIRDGASLADGKLYSSPLDPALLGRVFGPAVRYIGNDFKTSWNEATATLKASLARPSAESRVPRTEGAVASRVPSAIKSPLRAAANWVRMVTYADDAFMRSLADTLPDRSREAVRSFLDRWHTRAGDDRGAGRTYDEAVEARVNTAMTQLGRALGPILKNDAELAQVVRMVQNPSTIRVGTRLGDAAQGVSRLLGELHDYQVKAGVDMGNVKRGYFPRIIDTEAVWRSREGFLERAERAYRAAGEPKPREAAEAWLNNIVAGGKHDNVLTPPMSGIHADHVNGRTLTKGADEILRPFLHQDPRHVLATYISAAARRAEFARAVGMTKQKDGSFRQTHWDAVVKALREDGAEARIQELRNYVANVTGSAYAGSSPKIVKASGAIRMWATLGTLEKATLSSLAEAIMPGIRAGNMMDMGRSIARTIDDLVRGGKDGSNAARVRELAEDIGVIASAHTQSLNAARWAGGDVSSSFQNHVLDTYFRRTGLEQWTRATRVAAVSTGEVFLRRLSFDLAKGGRHERMARYSMAELGIPRAEQDAFAAFVRGQADSMTASSLHTAPPRQAEIFRTAIQRFVDQSIMRPSAATKPRWASHPLGSIAFQLNSFAWAFHTNVLMRPVNMIKSGNLTSADKAIMFGQMMAGLSAMFAAQATISAIRSNLLDDPRNVERRARDAQRNPLFHHPITGSPVGWEQMQLALSRSGLLGGFDPAFNLVTGVKYGKDLATSLAGPAAGMLLGTAQTGIEALSGRNSANTNNSERRVARAAWDIGVEPAANLALTWLPIPISAVLTQAAGHGAARGWFMDTMAGPEQRRRRME